MPSTIAKTADQLYERVATALEAVGWVPSDELFSPEEIPEHIRHRSFQVLPSSFEPSAQGPAIDTEVVFQIGVAYQANKLNNVTEMKAAILPDIDTFVDQLVDMDEFVPGTILSTIEPDVSDRFLILSMSVRLHYARNRTT